jgi:hypothetical protein
MQLNQSYSVITNDPSENKFKAVKLDPNRWKLHVLYDQTENILCRVVNLEDTVGQKFFKLNNLSEFDFRRITSSECVVTYTAFMLQESNALGSLFTPTVTLI